MYGTLIAQPATTSRSFAAVCGKHGHKTGFMVRTAYDSWHQDT